VRGRRKFIAAAILTLVGLACLGAGCSSTQRPESKTATPRRTVPSATSQPASSSQPRAVLINGRSVGYNWMAHWGYVGDGTVKKDGYTIAYKELDGNNIPSSFAENVADLAPGSVAFFKFCFVDFDGSNLSQRERELDQVLATAQAKGLKLVVGNALPVRREDGNAQVVAEERKFNEYLAQKAASNPGVWVFDFHGTLAGSDGYLKPEYQTGDSHPNDEAYDALDQTFFPLLGQVFAGTH
jgi:hypothetical protein